MLYHCLYGLRFQRASSPCQHGASVCQSYGSAAGSPDYAGKPDRPRRQPLRSQLGKADSHFHGLSGTLRAQAAQINSSKLFRREIEWKFAMKNIGAAI